MRRLLLTIIALVLGTAGVRAQAPASAAAAKAQAPAQAPAAAAVPPDVAATRALAQGAAGQAQTPAPPPQPESYTYAPEGRRDPFLSLIGGGGGDLGAPVAGRRADGPGGLTVAEIQVRGILQSRGALVAMVQGPDNKTYIVHQGDRLLDGSIKSITTQGLVVIQEVNDPLSLVKQREVSKLLRSLEGVK